VVAPPAPISPVSIAPTRGPVGSTAVVSFPTKQACSARLNTVTIQWAGSTVAKVPASRGSATIVIPPSKTGTFPVTAINTCGGRGGTRFTVTPRPRPTPTPTKSVPPTTPPTSPPATPTPGVTPTRPPVTATPTPGVTPSASATPPASPSPPASGLPPATPGGGLSLDRDNVRPGDPLTATGTGCDPGAPVTLASDDEPLGSTFADSAGGFVAPLHFANLEPGRRTITATCGPVLTTQVDLIVSSSTSGQAGTLVVLIFFILVGIALLRWQYNTGRR